MAAGNQPGASDRGTGHRFAAAVVVADADGREALGTGIDAGPGGVVEVLCVPALGAGGSVVGALVAVVAAGHAGPGGSVRARAGSAGAGRADAAAVEVAVAVLGVAGGAPGEALTVVEVLLLAALGAATR